MSRLTFVHLPVADLARSVDFFTALGFTFDEDFTDDRGGCMVISDQSCVMLLARAHFASLTTKAVADATTSTASIVGLSAQSREEVDALADTALALGGAPALPPSDDGVVYGRSFYDLDGHAWEVMWVDPAVA